MKIRNCNVNEISSLIGLLKFSGIYYAPLDTVEILSKKLKHDPESIIVADDNGKIVGTVFIIYDPWNSFVYHLAIHPNYQGKGFGNLLMDEAEKLLKKRGMNRPTLFVEEENENVLNFYKKRGWFVLYKTFCLEKEL